MSESEQGRINLEDNSDRPMSDEENKENVQERQEGQEGQEDQEAQQEAPKKEGGAWYEKPEGIGNSIGDKVQGGLNPVGKHVGPVLGRAAEPVGSVVGTVVGGVMKPGEGFGNMLGVGYGNKEGGPAKQEEAEHERMKADLGGKEQTGDNPLGL